MLTYLFVFHRITFRHPLSLTFRFHSIMFGIPFFSFVIPPRGCPTGSTFIYVANTLTNAPEFVYSIIFKFKSVFFVIKFFYYATITIKPLYHIIKEPVVLSYFVSVMRSFSNINDFACFLYEPFIYIIHFIIYLRHLYVYYTLI